MANDGVIPNSGRTEVQRLQQLELQFMAADPGRALVLRCVWNWRKNWLDLAETLQRVAKDGDWRGWGFASFDAYTRDELGLKPSEVHKLISALQFVKLELGSADCAVPAVPLPAVEVAMAAAEAAQAGQVEPELAKEIKDAVLSGQPIAPLKRQLKAQIETAKEEARGPDDAKREALQKTLRAAAALAEGLQALADARSSELVGRADLPPWDGLESLIERMRLDLERLQQHLAPGKAAPKEAVAAEPPAEPFKRVLFPEEGAAEEAKQQTPPTDPESVKRRASLSAWAKKYGALHGIKLRVPYGKDDHSLRALSLSSPVELTTLPDSELSEVHQEYERWFWAAKRKGDPASKPRRPAKAKAAGQARGRTAAKKPSKQPAKQGAPAAKSPGRKPRQAGLFETLGGQR